MGDAQSHDHNDKNEEIANGHDQQRWPAWMTRGGSLLTQCGGKYDDESSKHGY